MSIPPHFGIHAGNQPPALADGLLLNLAGARWLKVLSPWVTPAAVRDVRDAGLRVLLRAEGEGIVHWEEVLGLIREYAGLVEIIEIGNEPSTDGADLWDHAFYLDLIWRHCAQAAHDAGMRLCAPGWRVDTWIPDVVAPIPGDTPRLRATLWELYGRFPLLAIHCYDSFDLLAPGPQAHLARVAATWPDKEICITEFGIAADLPPAVKAARYAAFVRHLPARTVMSAAFLLNPTPDQATDPKNYRLTPALCAALGAALRA